jgi:hypothetical protein
VSRTDIGRDAATRSKEYLRREKGGLEHLRDGREKEMRVLPVPKRYTEK